MFLSRNTAEKSDRNVIIKALTNLCSEIALTGHMAM